MIKTNKIKIILLVILLSTTYLYANFIRSVMIDFSDFKKIEKNIYIESIFTETEEKDIQSLIANAKKRIVDKFGKLSSEPTIIVIKSSDVSLKYSTNLAGNTHISPWGNYVVIASKGRNIDVVAHELVHAEVAKRLGYFVRQFQFPVWLDEGIAMQVDYRKKYIVNSLKSDEVNRIQTLQSANSFWINSEEEIIKNYQGSKYVVNEILKKYPEKELFNLLSKINDGITIEDALDTINF